VSEKLPGRLSLCVIRARYSAFGGAERFVNVALDALVARGAQVTVLARSWPRAKPSDAQFSVIRCDPFYIGATWRDAGFASAVRAQLQKQSFDLVQSHERIPGVEVYRAGDGVHAAWLERRTKGQSFFERLGVALNPHHYYLRHVEKRLFEHPALRAVVCNSTMVRDEIKARFAIAPEKLHVIYNGVDLERFHPIADNEFRNEMRSRLGIDAEARVLLFLGSGFFRKGLTTALRALAKSSSNVFLVIVGRDKRAQRYQEIARDLGVDERCRFAGAVEDPLPFYAMADGFILPTLYDPFPNAVIEALACGLPVLTSTACGARDVIVDQQNGWLAESMDDATLGDQIRSFGELDAKNLERMQIAARATATGFDVALMGSRLFALYRELLSSS
jgi:UDP-glucose:(heptosyl)LPS alpha-1,3-glucosyltransferase